MTNEEDVKRVNDAYIQGYRNPQLDDPIEDLAATLKGLIALLAVIAGVAMVVMAWWR